MSTSTATTRPVRALDVGVGDVVVMGAGPHAVTAKRVTRNAKTVVLDLQSVACPSIRLSQPTSAVDNWDVLV